MELKTLQALAGVVVVSGMIASALYSAAEPNRKARRAAIFFIVAVFATVAFIFGLAAFVLFNEGSR